MILEVTKKMFVNLKVYIQWKYPSKIKAQFKTSSDNKSEKLMTVDSVPEET